MPGIRQKLPYLTQQEWQRLNDHKKKRGEKSIEVVYKFYGDVSREFGQYISSYIIPGFSSLKNLKELLCD